MASALLVNTCPACGAQESLDALLLRMADDDTARRLIADVVSICLPLGGLLVRYLRLHKPVKHKLRLDKAATLLGELVPDVQRGQIERNGRLWAVSPSLWRAALQATFDAVDKGTLALPLEGNGYLYGTLMRMASHAEGQDEKADERKLRGRAFAAGNTAIGALLEAGTTDTKALMAAAPAAPAPPRSRQHLAQMKATQDTHAAAARVDSPTVRAIKAEIAAKAAAKAAATAAPTPANLPTEERTSP